ncbi:hypothetical protein CCS41_03510 [Candidatus Fukatsuia symbiotica]|uniref:Uncharacterized protein n=1 Tax=Candidatus Fukatsuia symbiotica TaxID=1878942 RepID=A0A2U8I6F8_9GAMM|nr:hypothetical protein CCS41_03510 [Candidatus Fukatsuia symbiotica]
MINGGVNMLFGTMGTRAPIDESKVLDPQIFDAYEIQPGLSAGSSPPDILQRMFQEHLPIVCLAVSIVC